MSSSTSNLSVGSVTQNLERLSLPFQGDREVMTGTAQEAASVSLKRIPDDPPSYADVPVFANPTPPGNLPFLPLEILTGLFNLLLFTSLPYIYVSKMETDEHNDKQISYTTQSSLSLTNTGRMRARFL